MKIELVDFDEAGDEALLLAWRQDRQVMKYLPSAPELPTWADHYRHLQNGNTTYYWVSATEKIKRYSGSAKDVDAYLVDEVLTVRVVGVVHFKRDGEVGILIGEKAIWGKGVGKKALALLLEKLPVGTPLWAVIHPENIASQKVFEANGFRCTKEAGRNGQLLYRGFS